MVQEILQIQEILDLTMEIKQGALEALKLETQEQTPQLVVGDLQPLQTLQLQRASGIYPLGQLLM